MVKVRTDEGFTIVEVVVTLLFISIISLGILTMHTQVSILSIINRQDQKASYLAYDNMRKYVSANVVFVYRSAARRCAASIA